MEVILLERVEKLGQMGDIVSVKDGFARNFLLPKKKALRATAANKARYDAEKARLEADNLERKSEAEAIAAKVADVKCVLIRSAGDSGQLYGSVNSRDIAEAVTEAGVTIARSQVILNRAIKTLGLHDVDVRLHPEVTVSVVINIARSEEEAATQFETGAAVSSSLDDDDDFDIENAFDEDALPEETAEDGAEEAASEDATETEDDA